MEYCGATISRTQNGYELSYASYLEKVKPIPLKKTDQDNRPATPSEVRLLRGLIGALQWPATQGCPHISCSISRAQARIGKATVHDLKEANKTLRFAKTMEGVSPKFPKLPTDIGFLALSDAAWGTRDDGSSQGGYIIVIVPKTAFDDVLCDYAVMDWRSFKLHRVAKSSLCAETQAAADAADALEFVKTFWSLLDKPDISPLDISLRTKHPSALVVDAKALYDAIHKEAPLQGAANKRTGIELLVLRQTLTNTSSIVRWVSSERQIADGLTKTSARQLFSDRLRVQNYTLVYDESFTAAKKKTSQERSKSQHEHNVTPQPFLISA